MKATWNGVILAESETTEVVEGNHYFPPQSLNCEYFEESDTHTVCGWKGTANYYHIRVDGQRNEDSAWYYPDPKPEAKSIAGYVAFWYVAFWKGVEVQPSS